jgi:hypothetical protein
MPPGEFPQPMESRFHGGMGQERVRGLRTHLIHRTKEMVDFTCGGALEVVNSTPTQLLHHLPDLHRLEVGPPAGGIAVEAVEDPVQVPPHPIDGDDEGGTGDVLQQIGGHRMMFGIEVGERVALHHRAPRAIRFASNRYAPGTAAGSCRKRPRPT